MSEEMLGSIRQSPEYFVWSEPHMVKLIKNDKDHNLGVKVKTIQGKINPEITYTLVSEVRPQCSEQRREKLNSGYRIEAGNGVDITRMKQEEVVKILTSYKDGAMQLLVSYPLRLKDNSLVTAAVDDGVEKLSPVEFPDSNCPLDNQVSTLIRANLERCKSNESDHSVSLKSASDSEQPRPDKMTESGANIHKKGSEDIAGSNIVTTKTAYQKRIDSADRDMTGRGLPYSVKKQFATNPGSPSHSSQSLPIIPTSQSSPTRTAPSPRPPMLRAVSLTSPDELYDITLEDPHLIVWSAPSKGIEIDRDVDGKLGFRYKEVQNKEDPKEVFTLVKEVFANSPALGSLQKGDRILSVNGQHLQDTRKGINTASIVNMSQGETVRIIIQRPRGLRERKPLNPTDIKLDLSVEQMSSGLTATRSEPQQGQRIPARSPTKAGLSSVEGKKRPHSGSSASYGPGTSLSSASRPIQVHEAPDQSASRPKPPQQWTSPVHRPNFLPCDAPYSNMHTTYHMTRNDPNGLDSMDNPVLVSMKTDILDITIRSGSPVASSNTTKKACNLQLNINASPHGSPSHTPTKDGSSGMAMETTHTASTSTPTPNDGCTCLALWNSPLKDSFKKISRKPKCEGGSGHNNTLDPRDVNCNNLNSGDMANGVERNCLKKNINHDGNQNCTHGINGDNNDTGNDAYELRPIRVSQDTHIRNVPCGLFLLICRHMNVNMVLGGKDWRGLADEMGKSMQDILVLEQKDDPCKALLKDWGASSQATLGRLMEILHKLTREDVIEDINNYISSN